MAKFEPTKEQQRFIEHARRSFDASLALPPTAVSRSMVAKYSAEDGIPPDYESVVTAIVKQGKIRRDNLPALFVRHSTFYYTLPYETLQSTLHDALRPHKRGIRQFFEGIVDEDSWLGRMLRHNH